MPEYLAPGVYVEETSYRSKSIEGVSTTTTGFIGPTRYGPVNEDPEILTSLGEFERTVSNCNQWYWGECMGFDANVLKITMIGSHQKQGVGFSSIQRTCYKILEPMYMSLSFE